MKHLVVVNPLSGRRRGPSAADSVSQAFRAHGLPFECVTTSHAGHARELTADLGSRFDSVVVAGGDGTLHEVIQALDLDRHRLGVIPLGTGNDFAWMNGWPDSIDGCLRRIVAGAEKRLDLGAWEAEVDSPSRDATDMAVRPRSRDDTDMAVSNSRHSDVTRDYREGRFHNSIGLGFEALVNRESARMKGRFGPLTYVLALARSLPRYRQSPVKATWEGGAYDGPTTLLDVCVGKRVGGCFLIAPEADSADGKLDLIVADGMPLPRALVLLPRLFKGTHVRSSVVRTFRASEVGMTFPADMPMYVDGEFVSDNVSSLKARVLPGALKTF